MKAHGERAKRAAKARGRWRAALLASAIGLALAISSHGGAAVPSGTPGVTVSVRSVVFTGPTGLLTAEEQAALQSEAVGRDLDFAGLQALADRASRIMQEKGRLLAFAYLPEQDVTEGRVEIALAEGVVEGWKFEPEGGLRVRPSRLEAIARAAARPGEPLTKQGLERALLLMGDLANVRGRATLQRGEAPNSTRVVVAVDEVPGVTGTLSLDNHGNHASGAYQAAVLLNLNGLLGAGERLEVAGSLSEGARLVRASGRVGLGGSGLRLGGRIAATTSTVMKGAGASAEIAGETFLWRLNLDYPLSRSRASNVWGSLAFGQRTAADSLAGDVFRERRVRTMSLGLSGDASDLVRRRHTAWEIELTSGATEVKEGVDDVPPQFATVTFDLERLQRLSTAWSWSARVRGQWSGTNLGSSEKFALGGPGGVRAYPVGEGSGDQGAVATVELSYDVPLARASNQLQLSTFLDAGWVRLYSDPPDEIPTITGRNTYALTGAGVLVSWRAGASLSFELGWAQALGENPGQSIFGKDADGKTGRSRIWTQAKLTF